MEVFSKINNQSIMDTKNQENGQKPPAHNVNDEPVYFVPQEVINDFQKIFEGMKEAQKEMHEVQLKITNSR
jgi:hypothetical protein